VELRYTGPATTFDASQMTGAKDNLVFTRNGKPQRVTKDLAENLLTYPEHSFIDVTPERTAKETTDGARSE
jgi:hypothetical protein